MFIRRVIPAVACLLLLTACGTSSPSATPSTSASPSATSTVVPQTSLDGIKVVGKKGAVPKLQFKTPFTIDKTRTKVLDEGSGPAALADGYVTINYYGVNGRDGKLFDSSWARKATATFQLGQVIPGFTTGLTGQKVGSRVLVAIPGADGYDSQGGNSDAGIKVGDTLIFVVEMLDVSVAQPSGTTITPPAGLPTVTGGPADKPTVAIPATAAPTTMAAQTLIEGTGSKVLKTDTIYARFVAYSWQAGKLVQDQWTPITGVLAKTIPGWQTGLLGKTVGSRVLLVLPPKYGYPEGANNPPLTKGDTVVYVVDILFREPTTASS